MKNLHPIGIPHSIFFEELFPVTFDAGKLEEDKERIRDAYQKEGYFTAKALDQTLKLRDVGGYNGGWHIPIFKENRPGKVEDITLPVEEGPRYYLAKIDFEGVKLFKSTEFLSRLFQMQPGTVFSTEKLRNGLKNLTKVYSQFGYIDYVAEPQIDIVPNSNKIDLTLNADEGKQFFVRRIDFTGNTTTRDKVIRRQILIDEGDVYNSTLWDASILRLNQLGYFEVLKENDSYELKRNAGTNTVDILLKVKERGKNSISLNGGVSGISGTFIGLNYSTNNFLGLGETLTAQAQVGTLQDRITLGFTEPYLFDRPLQAGVTVYLSRFNYDQARQESLLTGINLQAFYNSLGQRQCPELCAGFQRRHAFSELPDLARLRARRNVDRLRYIEHQDRIRRRRILFHLHQLPERERPQCAQRHQDPEHHAQLQLQFQEQFSESDGGKEHLLFCEGVGQRTGRECQRNSADFRRPVLSSEPALAQERTGVSLCRHDRHRLRRKRRAAVHALLHRRRKRCARIRFLQHCAHRIPAQQRVRQRAESRWQPAHAERDRRRRKDASGHFAADSHVSDHHARAEIRMRCSTSNTGFPSSDP